MPDWDAIAKQQQRVRRARESDSDRENRLRHERETSGPYLKQRLDELTARVEALEAGTAATAALADIPGPAGK